MLLFTAAPGHAQVVVERYQPAEGTLRIGLEPDEVIQRTDRGYTLILPEGQGTPAGIVVFLDGFRVDVPDGPPPEGTFDHAALASDVGVLRLTTGNPLDFYFDESTLRDTAHRLEQILEDYDLRDVPVFLAGLSLGGTRALRLAVFFERNRTEFAIRPAAVALVDAPLDMARLWATERDAIAADFHPTAAGEGRWVTYLLEANLGGPPSEAWDAYVTHAPYTHGAPDGGNASHLRELPIRAYHEPDVDWWIENRRKSYYAMNSLDLAGLINQLRLLGNERAELITTHRSRDGYDEGATPHTWSIVDDAELVEWFLSMSARSD